MEIYFPFSRSLATQVLRDGLNCFMLASLFSKYESMTRRLLAIQVAWEVAWKNLSNHSGRAYFSMEDKMLFDIYLKCAYFISQLTHSDPSKGISRQLLGFNKMGYATPSSDVYILYSQNISKSHTFKVWWDSMRTVTCAVLKAMIFWQLP